MIRDKRLSDAVWERLIALPPDVQSIVRKEADDWARIWSANHFPWVDPITWDDVYTRAMDELKETK